MKKGFKHIVSFITLIVLSFSLIGCVNQEANDNDKTLLDQIKERGTIVVGTSPDYPPFETIDDEGNIVGFDIDLLNEIAKELEVEVDLKEMSFDTIVTMVQNGQLDIGMSGFSIDPERLLKVDMSDPYLVGGQVIVSTKDSGINSAEDLKGHKVAVGIGTTGAAAAENLEGIEIVSLENFNIGFNMLKNGSVKAVIADLPVGEEYVKKDSDFVIVGEPIEYEEYGVVIDKGNEELTAAINDAIQTLKDNGTLDELKANWNIK